MGISKIIKDPIYGYISIDDDCYAKVLDSVYFQRLKNIIQTSYISIYPSSLHNRFTHSLGVFWLGKIAFDALIKNSTEISSRLDKVDIDATMKTFVLACMCHDLGHSPFSHTGEVFYDKVTLSQKLDEIVDDPIYTADRAGKTIGNEHEIMSAYLAINKFGAEIGRQNYSLFARCIIGLQYNKSDANEDIVELYRACIEMLNSSIIDVDKLDYLIRDSYMSGYASVSIDYVRLLNAIFINTSGEYPIGYYKSALSVLETVLTAHDMERRWIQSHPAIQYESYLLKTIIREIVGQYEGHLSDGQTCSLLSYATLTEEGANFKEIGVVRLLSDADVIFLSKINYENSAAVQEYWDRAKRRYPLWKSEAEFHALFNFEINSKVLEILKNWETQLLTGDGGGEYTINERFLAFKAKTLEDLKATNPEKLTFVKKLKTLETEVKLLSKIKGYCVSHNVPFDFVIISQDKFKRNIYKPKFKELPILFQSIDNEPRKLDKVSALPMNLEKDDTDPFFYLYYDRSAEVLNAKEFVTMLMIEFRE